MSKEQYEDDEFKYPTDVVLSNNGAGAIPMEKKPGKLDNGEEEGPVTMAKNITLVRGTCIIVSTIIGTGIFITPNVISKNVQSPAMSILVWLGGGCVATIGGITFCELGTMFPSNGAEITYLRKAYGMLVSFLSCFLLHLCIGGLRRAIQFLSFSKYFWAIFYDATNGEAPPWILDKAVCIAVLMAIIAIIMIYPSVTLKIINVMTAAKLISVSVIIVIGIVKLSKGEFENISQGFNGTNWNPQKWGNAWNSVLWSYNGWNVVCILLGEVKDPTILPKIVGCSVAIVTVFYMMTVVSYHSVLDMETMNTAQVAVASEVARKYLGESGVIFFAVAVAVSALGNTMCSLLGTSRYLQAAGAQGVLPGVFGLISRRFRTPIFALFYMFLATTLFVLVGDLSSLINSATYTSFAFTTLCSIGVIVMRFTKPDHPRPIKVWLIFPMITASFGIYMFIIPWFSPTRAMNAMWLAITIVGGIPVYFACVNKQYRRPALVRFSEKITAFVGKHLNSEVNLQ
ncbi:hypothetical protein ACHWQZ_G013974 [Mnemiopsis leidyi]